MPELHRIQPADLKKILDTDPQAQVIDVRENIEHAAEALEGSTNLPLSGFEKTLHTINREKPVYLLCRSGNRASQAAQRLAEQGYDPVNIVEGGIEACKSEGLAVKKGPVSVWAMDRQVRLTAGSLILLGLVLGWTVHAWFTALSVFVASGLVYSAITDTCGMALMLAKMPWNRVKKCG